MLDDLGTNTLTNYPAPYLPLRRREASHSLVLPKRVVGLQRKENANTYSVAELNGDAHSFVSELEVQASGQKNFLGKAGRKMVLKGLPSISQEYSDGSCLPMYDVERTHVRELREDLCPLDKNSERLAFICKPSVGSSTAPTTAPPPPILQRPTALLVGPSGCEFSQPASILHAPTQAAVSALSAARRLTPTAAELRERAFSALTNDWSRPCASPPRGSAGKTTFLNALLLLGADHAAITTAWSSAAVAATISRSILPAAAAPSCSPRSRAPPAPPPVRVLERALTPNQADDAAAPPSEREAEALAWLKFDSPPAGSAQPPTLDDIEKWIKEHKDTKARLRVCTARCWDASRA